MEVSFDSRGLMKVVFEKNNTGKDVFLTKKNTKYLIDKKLTVASVNSHIWFVTSVVDDSRYVLKLSYVANDDAFFENKIQVYKRLHKLKSKPIQVQKMVNGVLTDLTVKVSDCMMTSIENGIMTVSGIRLGYVIEPFIENFSNFEEVCLKWHKLNLGVDEFVFRLEFVLNSIILILKGMLAYGFNHNDCHLRNIMVNSETGDVKLIDYDWSTFHDPRHLQKPMAAQVIMMSVKYFKRMREFVESFTGTALDTLCDEELDDSEPCLQLATKTLYNTLHAKNMCEMLHYYIHAKYSISHYLKEEPSPSVDFAKCCIDFYKKFIGIDGCEVYDTEFVVTEDVQTIRSILKEKLLPKFVTFYAKHFDVTNESILPLHDNPMTM
jgi:hypothetical protein